MTSGCSSFSIYCWVFKIVIAENLKHQIYQDFDHVFFKLHGTFLGVVLISTRSYQHRQNTSIMNNLKQAGTAFAGTLIGCHLCTGGQMRVLQSEQNNQILICQFSSHFSPLPNRLIDPQQHHVRHIQSAARSSLSLPISFLDVRTWGLQRYIQAVTHTDNVEVQWGECASVQSSYSINKLRECKLITFSA